MSNQNADSQTVCNDAPNFPDPTHPLVVTELDGEPPVDAFSLFQAVGRTACGTGVLFHRNFRRWTVSRRDPDTFDTLRNDRESGLFHPEIHEFPERVSIEILRQVVAPHLTFTPDALLPLAVDNPTVVENLLRQGANPNRQPAILRCSLAMVRGRLPLVVLDELIAGDARWLQRVYDDLPSPEPSGVEALENLTGLHIYDPSRCPATNLSERVDKALRCLEKKRRARQLLRDAGAFEVADYMRAVRTHCFHEAEEFLAAGLPVDVLQGAGCTMLTERIFARDDIAVDWLLDNGADPNFLPHADAGMTGAPLDVIDPVAVVCRQEHPRQLARIALEEWLQNRSTATLLLTDFFGVYDSQRKTGPLQPIAAALLADNRPAFEKLLERGADVHAVPIFQICLPPEWAFARLASLEIDWLQMWGGNHSRCPAVLLWRAREDRPEWVRGRELWEKHASHADREEAAARWSERLEYYGEK